MSKQTIKIAKNHLRSELRTSWKMKKKHKTKLDVRFFERNYPCGSIPSLRRKYWPHNSFQYLQDHFFLLSTNLFKKKIKWRQNKLQSNLKWWYTKTFIFHWVSYWKINNSTVLVFTVINLSIFCEKKPEPHYFISWIGKKMR